MRWSGKSLSGSCKTVASGSDPAPRRSDSSRRSAGDSISDERSFNRDAEMTELVLTETRGAISLLTFNRPEKLNALSYGLIDRLMQILDRIEDDPRIHAVIVTGAGDRAFS